MTNHFENKKSEFDPGEEFIKSGGKILESHPDGRPARWKCGKGENGAPIHPKGMIKEAVTYINKDGELEGRELDDKYREEIKLWRSDWIIPEEGRKEKE
jgi:hypothetical protein